MWMSEFHNDSDMMITNKNSMGTLSIISFLWVSGTQLYLVVVYYLQAIRALG